jgi:transposase
MNEGRPLRLIAEILGVNRQSLYCWRDLSRSESGLAMKRPTGRPCKLTDQQVAELKELLSRGATAHGWCNDLWTAKRVASLIWKQFRIKYSSGNVQRLLKSRVGWSVQRPTRQLRGRDDQEIQRWLTEDYSRILDRAKHRHAHVVFIDESGFLLAPYLRRTYAPRGRQPVVKSADPHGRISVIGAITISPKRRRYGFHFHLLEDNANFHGYSIVPFIDGLRRWIAGPFTVIWDGILIHRAKPLIEYVAKHRRIVIETFPPEASELNPVDNVWGYVKYGRLSNYTPSTLTELRSRIKSEFKRLQGRPDLLEASFRRTGLTLNSREPIKTSWSANGRLIIGEHGKERYSWSS